MKRLVVLGGGESGVGTAILGKKEGYEVFVSDFGKITEKYKNVLTQYNIDWEEEKHTEALVLNADVVMKSPGIPDKAPMVKKLVEKGIPVISEIEFAYPFTKAKTIGITGSNGKTTTTMLTYHLLKEGGLNVGLGGNIGKSFAWQVAEENYDYYVLELSSFQLDGIINYKPDIALLTNISPDHLDRYDYDYGKYIAAKFNIVKNQTEQDFFIYNADDATINSYLKGMSTYAQLAPLVLKYQQAGDPYALDIMQRALHYVQALLSRLQKTGATRVAMIGGLAPFITNLLPLHFQQQLSPVLGPPEVGAVALARQRFAEKSV